MTREEVIEKYGVDPQLIGLRNRGWWILEELDEADIRAGAQKGDLGVKARDGSSNPTDMDALKKENCVGTSEDDFDCTYRYYYFRKISHKKPILAKKG